MSRLARVSARRVAVFACSAAIGFAATLGLAMSVPVLFGYQSLTMLSGSMAPALPVGAVVLDETIRPLEARPGDVLTFSDPNKADRLLTHRLRSIRVENDSAHMVTRGDANRSSEKWTVPLDGTVGRVKTTIPFVGYVRAWVHQNAGRTTMLTALSVIGLWTLLDVWLPQPLSVMIRSAFRSTSGRRVRSTAAAAAGLRVES